MRELPKSAHSIFTLKLRSYNLYKINSPYYIFNHENNLVPFTYITSQAIIKEKKSTMNYIFLQRIKLISINKRKIIHFAYDYSIHPNIT